MLIYLAATRLAVSSCMFSSSSSGALNGSVQQLLPGLVTTKLELIGYSMQQPAENTLG